MPTVIAIATNTPQIHCNRYCNVQVLNRCYNVGSAHMIQSNRCYNVDNIAWCTVGVARGACMHADNVVLVPMIAHSTASGSHPDTMKKPDTW
jgi:hypothetical protein